MFVGSFLPDYLKYGSDSFYDKIIDSGSISNKLALVRIHYGLDRLCDDSSPLVKLAVRRVGYKKPKISDSSDQFRTRTVVF